MRRPNVISFLHNVWGHSMHFDTWARVEGKRLDKFLNRRRYSVLVHSVVKPSIGDLVEYKVDGGKATAEIYAFENFHEPCDMYKLFLMRDTKLDKKFNQIEPAERSGGDK